MTVNNRRELWIARFSILATLICLAGFFEVLFSHLYRAVARHDIPGTAALMIFLVAMVFMAYGNLLYQICLAGYHKRIHKHRPATRAQLESLYDGSAPTLCVLVPSYKEERTVIWQTLVSAALAEYPQKDIVLLIDDPHRPKLMEDIHALDQARAIPETLQALFDAPLARYRDEYETFVNRRAEGKTHVGVECNRLSLLYDAAADWLDVMAEDFIGGRSVSALSHIDRFFLDRVIGEPAAAHRKLAQELRDQLNAGVLGFKDIERQYRRLTGLFNVRFTRFERKKYVNLSHEANKAMNLNSYISLMGKSWKEMQGQDGLMLMECGQDEADFSIMATDFVNTIDADSQMLCDYALRLVHRMRSPGNERIAVMQSPCSAYPGAANGLERAAGAAIDLQFETHQGYAQWNAAFWVGANAMLRFCALQEVCMVRQENGYPVSVYIKDRTVIEDTESSIDMVHRGWRLCNYPQRLTFSSMPSDFGSLLIQRRRWANGGLLILPNLLRYLVHAPKNLALLKECFIRFHYLVSSASGCLIALLLFIYSFATPMETFWLPLSMLPFFALYVRDLRNAGYRFSDMIYIFALNLMLLPVITGGVLKSLEQMATGRKIPFGRTPKVPGRTAAPAFYSLIEIVLPPLCLAFAVSDAMKHHWMEASIALSNGLLLLYAFIFFLGVRQTFQDVAAGARQALRLIGGSEEWDRLRRIPMSIARWQRAAE